MKFFIPLFFISGAVLAADVPSYSVRVGLDSYSKVPRWLIELTPPSGFHFNLSAPMGVSVSSRSVNFTAVTRKGTDLGFSSSVPALKEGDEVQASAFLCDEAKTLCVKKTSTFPLKVNSDLKELKGDRPEAGASAASSRGSSSKKDSFGFHFNDLGNALRESKTTGKPLLIEFFGIWCPPCNLYQETVFPDRDFKRLARSFVVLRMDADREESFALKSHLRVGGYPTWIAVKAVRDLEVSGLSEMGRVVGYLPPREFNAKLTSFIEHRSESIDERILRKKNELVSELKQKAEFQLDEKAPSAARETLASALKVLPEDPGLKLLGLVIEFQADPSHSWSSEADAVLASVFDHRATVGSDLLLDTVEFILGHESMVPKVWVERSDGLLAELKKRVDAQTLFVPGLELSLPDLGLMQMERAELLKDQTLVSKLRIQTIQDYEALLALHPGLDSRGINLDFAALLAQSGEWKRANSIYDRFIKKFPKEFTFYFAAAKVALEQKELKRARELAEKAVEFAYGDNLIRCMDRAVKVMRAQGEFEAALKRGEAFLGELKVDPRFRVRTGRYVAQLKNTLEEIRKERPHP